MTCPIRIFFALLLVSAACGSPEAPATTTPKPEQTAPDTLRDGRHVFKDEQGRKRMEGGFMGGRRHGLWTTYNSQGRVRSRSEYVEGLLEGPTVTFRDNGALYYQGQHQHGVKVGEWRFYDEHGDLVRTVTFDAEGNEVKAP